MENPDKLLTFILDNLDVRGELVQISSSLETILKQRDYPIFIKQYLAQMIVASALISAMLKFKGSLTLQLTAEAESPLKWITVNCNHNLNLKALAKWDKAATNNELDNCIKSGKLIVTINNEQHNKPYQGIIQLNNRSITQAIEKYFLKSEQIHTKIYIAHDLEQHPPLASGMLIQRLPTKDMQNKSEQELYNNFCHASLLCNTVTNTEMLTEDMHTLLHKLFHQEQLKLNPKRNIQFKCTCSVSKMENAVRTMDRHEIESLLKENKYIFVTCEFCNYKFKFSADYVQNMLVTH